MTKVGIVGASGYAGGELLRIFTAHPHFEVAWATSRQYAGRKAGDVFPSLRDFSEITLCAPSLEKIPESVEAVLLALPHTEALDAVPVLLERGLKVVDLSADHRLDIPKVYTEWYGAQHPSTAVLDESVYGLTEWNRREIESSRLVANPGCYPTAALLALLPLVKGGIVTPEIIIDAKSGVSGAGRSPKVNTLFCEANEGLRAYSVGIHRHIPEIEQELGKMTASKVDLTFTPHLVPLSRGLLETIYVTLEDGAGIGDVEKAYAVAYGGETFVKVAPAGSLPGIQDVAGTNLCRIGFSEYGKLKSRRVVIVSVIDNLIKGAAGQAVQNLNLLFGLPEETGLSAPGLFP